MRKIEKWIWLDGEKYPDAQTTVFHPFGAITPLRSLREHTVSKNG